MANKRQELQLIFEGILGSTEVYFQASEGKAMSYPAIKFKKSTIENKHADNEVYIQSQYYEIVVMDSNPDRDIAGVVSKLPRCRQNTQYVTDNLYHDVFTIYF